MLQKKFPIITLGVIAVVILVIGLGAYFVLTPKGERPLPSAPGETVNERVSNPRLEYTKNYLKTEGLPCDREDSFGTAVGNIVIDHNNTDTLYITARPKGVFKSDDWGKTWKAVNKGIYAYPSQKDKGRLCYDWLGKLYIDPTNSQRILLVATDVNNGTIEDPYTEMAGLWETLDGGTSWHQLLKPWMNAGGYGALAIDPRNSQIVYFGSGYGAASYTEANPNEYYNTIGFLYKTIDGGKSWEELPTGLYPGRDKTVTVEPTRLFLKGDALILFPAVIAIEADGSEVTAKNQFGLLKSLDQGETWTSLKGNLPEKYQMPLGGDVAKHNFDHIFIRSWHTEFEGDKQQSFYSLDGGKIYNKTSIDVDKAHYDPYDDQGLHIIGYSPFTWETQLVESFDGGATWQKLGEVPEEIRNNQVFLYDIAWDPKDRDTIYITGGPPHVWRSEDGGKTWQNILKPPYLP